MQNDKEPEAGVSKTISTGLNYLEQWHPLIKEVAVERAKQMKLLQDQSVCAVDGECDEETLRDYATEDKEWEELLEKTQNLPPINIAPMNVEKIKQFILRNEKHGAKHVFNKDNSQFWKL